MSMTQEARFVVMEGQVDRGSRLSESEGFGEGSRVVRFLDRF